MTTIKSTLLICPTETKNKLLRESTSLKDIKYLTKEEYKSIYYFSYDEKSYYYLMQKYHYNIDVCKIYLKNLYVIDENKIYQSPKLNFLKDLKKELIENHLLVYNKSYQKYLNTKDLKIENLYDLDLYEEKMLNTTLIYDEKIKITNPIVECQTIEEEINHVALSIIDLLKKNVPLNKIYLTNVTEEYFYPLKKIFAYYKIPLNLDFKYSIYSTKVIKDYLNDGILDLEDPSKKELNKKLLNILGDLSSLDSTTKEYKTILIDKLKNTHTSSSKLKNAINIKNLYNETFSSDEYVFLVGFNQDVLPKMEKDIAFISDKEKEEVDLYSTSYLNKRNKLALITCLSKIPNLYLSYKLSTPFAKYYKSSLVIDLALEVIPPHPDTYNASNTYNELRLAEKLDLYNLYNEKSTYLEELASSYHIPYKTYSNAFTGLDNDLYLTNLPYPLKLSYTSLNAYSECAFKYYIRHVLKLEPYTDNFPSFVGSLYHYILSLYTNTSFSFEKEWENYLSKRELTFKEKLLLVRIKNDLIELLNVLKKQKLLTGYDEEYHEKKLDVDLQKKVSVIFTGTIDKIMYYQKVENTYFSIIDYKTGTIDTHIEPMKYGLHMQLPVYLYLIHNSKFIKSPIFTGIYYQNILFNYPTWDKNVDKLKTDQYLLHGYSTENISALSRFDSTYEKSELIKSMAYSEEKGFSYHTKNKIINDEMLGNLLNYTKDYISKTTDSILEADFKINPKIYAGTDEACSFCVFKDLCYKTEKDYKYLDKVTDLSFLGGE